MLSSPLFWCIGGLGGAIAAIAQPILNAQPTRFVTWLCPGQETVLS
ncbi:MAG: hypothetical protein KME14_08005 [Tildeniella torsiva UHER 1998/13D]|nr:hypothetical protein [Tildeniella torsiva UHER 1998/13D]